MTRTRSPAKKKTARKAGVRRRPSPKKRQRRSARDEGRLIARRLTLRLREILGPEDGHSAERLAEILTQTMKELEAQRSALRVDPRRRQELETAKKKLAAFYDFWKAHPKIHGSVPRSNPETQPPVSAVIAEILRSMTGAIARLPGRGSRNGSDEIIRRWLSLAVVSTLRSPDIRITRDASGKSVLILELVCRLMRLPAVRREVLWDYLRTGSEWAAKIPRT